MRYGLAAAFVLMCLVDEPRMLRVNFIRVTGHLALLGTMV